jgi:hypothetical protein
MEYDEPDEPDEPDETSEPDDTSEQGEPVEPCEPDEPDEPFEMDDEYFEEIIDAGELIPIPPPRRDIDKITLECFMNRGKYNKYLLHTNREQYKENQRYEEKRELYTDRIMEYTAKLLQNEESAHNTDIKTNFHNYISSLVKYFEYDEKVSADYNPNYDYDGNGFATPKIRGLYRRG